MTRVNTPKSFRHSTPATRWLRRRPALLAATLGELNRLRRIAQSPRRKWLVGIALTFLSGMPSMVRTRFSTPTIGREWMIGEMGLALTSVDPDGTVSVRSARWPARTNRATPIGLGDRVRVVGIEGVVLEVEPEEGGAIDYRERRRASKAGGGAEGDRDE